MGPRCPGFGSSGGISASEGACRSSAKSDSYPLRDYSSASAPGSDLPEHGGDPRAVEERDEKPDAGDDHGGERDIQLVRARNPRSSPGVGTGADYQLTPSC